MSGDQGFAEGWYSDPAGRGAERYWDGEAWTGERRTAEPGEFLGSLGARPPRPYGVHEIARGARDPSSPRPVVHFDDSTRSVWLIALSPLWLGLGAYFLSWVAAPLRGAGTGLVAALLVGGAVALLVAAELDRSALRARGALRAASPLWMLLTPLGYLVARWSALRGVEGRRSAPLATCLVLGAAILLVTALFALLVNGTFLTGAIIGESLS